MTDSKLIKIFKRKKTWDKKLLEALGITTPGLIPILSSMTLHWLPISILVIFVFMGFSLSFGGYSVFKMYPRYMICNTPLFFWKYKKLIFYNKIEEVIIHKDYSYRSYTVNIYTLDDKAFEYYLDVNLVEDFVDALESYKVKVKVKAINYRRSTVT